MPDNGKPEVTESKPKREIVPVSDQSEAAALLDTAKFDHLWRVATLFSQSDLLPDHFKGKPSNCMIAISSALRSRIDPMLFLQHTYMVSGKLGIDGQIAIAMLNSRGGFKGGVKFKWVGTKGRDDFGCQAYGIDDATGEVLEGPPVTMETVKAEGWYGDDKGMKETRNGGKIKSKWLTMPTLMFMYRAASWFGRTHRPEVLMGFPTEGELEERAEPRNVTPEMPSEIAARAAMEMHQPTPEPEPEKVDTRLPDDQQKPEDAINDAQIKVITNAFRDAGLDEVTSMELLGKRGFQDLCDVTVEGFPLVLQDIIRARKAK